MSNDRSHKTAKLLGGAVAVLVLIAIWIMCGERLLKAVNAEEQLPPWKQAK